MTIYKSSSEAALSSIRDQVTAEEVEASKTLPLSVLQTWESLPDEVRSLLVNTELNRSESAPSLARSLESSSNSTPVNSTPPSSNSSDIPETSSSSDQPHNVTDHNTEDNTNGYVTSLKMTPLERAPENVFSFTKIMESASTKVTQTAASTVTTTTKVVTGTRGWRNVFTLPIAYDVNMIPRGTILDPSNLQLLHATGVHSSDYNRRFAVLDAEVNRIYGKKIREYFESHGMKLTTCVLNGGEAEKRTDAVDILLDALCAYKCRRREPFLAIGGGVLLDIAGMGACLYRRGVPFVRVPTTLLAIVDASVGVKNGVDFCCGVTNETYKNRVGAFYAPSSCLLDPSFIETQDVRNVSNGLGEIMKLALVRSSDLFELLEAHGADLIQSRFGPNESTPPGVAERIIDLSIQIMLEELGPNLWETKLERCVDYGHTFSKLLEMVPGADIMHGEAVNVDGFFCVILSYLRGYITMDTVNEVFKVMKSLSLPTNSEDLKLQLAWQSCKDAIEHRHGEQRIPLITEIGESICVSDITEDELERAIEHMKEFPH